MAQLIRLVRLSTGHERVIVKEKVCSKCKEKKDIECFSKGSSTRDGKASWCRTCLQERDKQRRAEKKMYSQFFKF